MNVGDQNIRVSMNIPPGYLGYENFGMGRGVSKRDFVILSVKLLHPALMVGEPITLL